jgi:hypothetical protein
MAVLSIQNLLLKFGAGKSPRSQDYLDLIDTLADDRNAVYFSATAPEDTAANPLWFNTTTNVLSVYDGEWFTTPGPTGATGAASTVPGPQGETGATGPTGPAGTTNYNELTNLPNLSVYATETYADNAATTAVAAAIDSAPATLNTLNELAAAINDDASFASTVTTALGTKAPIDSPTFTGTVAGITKSMVGLSNVDNTTDANKPISSATQTALDAKLASATASTTYETITNVALKAPIANPTFTGTVAGITKTMVGLDSVDNTSDAAKPVSTAQQTALDLKANLSGPTFTGTTTIDAIADATITTAARGAGYMGVPQSPAATTGAYTIVAADAGEHIYSTATRTVTIPANASVAFPIGTAITFIAATGTTVTIAITTDTLLLAGPGTTGSRTLAPFGMATAIKITSTSWIISGNGLT